MSGLSKRSFAVALVLLLASGCFGGKKAGVAPSTSPSVEPLTPYEPPPPPERVGGFSQTSVFPGTYDTSGNFSRVLAPGPLKIGPVKVEVLPSAATSSPVPDGVVQLAYVLPEVAAGIKVPVIAVASPYFKDLDSHDFRGAHNANPTNIGYFLVENFVPHGYAVAFIAIRGTGGSGGCYGWWTDDERRDIVRAVDWLGKAPWSSGAVGMIGLSLAGAGAWEAAGGSSYVKTIVPIASETDLYTWFTRNGTSTLVAGPAGTTAFWGVYSVAPVESEASNERDPELIAGAAACPDLATSLGASLAASATGQQDPLGEWASRDLRPAVEKNYHGSVFLVHGLRDGLAYAHLVHPWVQTLENKGVVVKQLLGQWRHKMPDTYFEGPYNPTPRWDFAEMLLHWFEYWLKGDLSQDLGPRVQVADTSNQWRNELTWPPHALSFQFFLGGDGKLTYSQTTTQQSATLAPDPARTPTAVDDPSAPRPPCNQCLVLETDPLPEDLRFAGLPKVMAKVTPDGPGGHVAAFLYSVEPTRTTRLSYGVMDLRFSGAGAPGSPVTPGTAITIGIELEPTDAFVPKGSKLRLELAQSGYGEGFDEFAKKHTLASMAYYRPNVISNPVEIEYGGAQSSLRLGYVFAYQGQFFTAPAAPPPPT